MPPKKRKNGEALSTAHATPSCEPPGPGLIDQAARAKHKKGAGDQHPRPAMIGDPVQAKLTDTFVFRRRRIAPPTSAKPAIIIAHEAGSGTAAVYICAVV